MALSLRNIVHHRYGSFIPGGFSVIHDVLSLAKYDVGEQMYRTADGHVSLLLLLSALEQPPLPFDLTGFWAGDEVWLSTDGATVGSTYYLKQEANGTLWWVGLSNDDAAVNQTLGLQSGLSFANVFKGQIQGHIIEGAWASVPRGESLHNGRLSLSFTPVSSGTTNQVQFKKIASSGDAFGASVWKQISLADLAEPPHDTIQKVFDQVKKNQNAFLDHSLHDGLKPYKDSAVVFCTAMPDPDLPTSDQQNPVAPQWHVNYPPHTDVSSSPTAYENFICLYSNQSPPDGDLNVHIQLERDQLDASATFWTDGWEHDAQIIKDKLDASGNEMHFEVIMFGRTAQCGDDLKGANAIAFELPPLLPGWQEAKGNSVLLNGRPINGKVDIGDPIPGQGGDFNKEYYVTSVGGKVITQWTHLRVTGVVILDCGHADDQGLRPCHEGDPGFQNQEIHPVYAIDIIDATSSDDLSGTWSDDDGRTFYLRQLGDNTIWGLGMSPFRDHSFARVYQGTIQPDQTITGIWADIPHLGQGQTTGSMTIQIEEPGRTCLFGNTICRFVASSDSPVKQRWTKLYDIPPPV
jgi:hypothetical protein